MFPITKAGAPYGAVEYVGDFTTDRYGKAAYIFSFVVEEAFDFNNETQVRKELSSVDFGRRPNDDGCLGAASPGHPVRRGRPRACWANSEFAFGGRVAP